MKEKKRNERETRKTGDGTEDETDAGRTTKTQTKTRETTRQAARKKEGGEEADKKRQANAEAGQSENKKKQKNKNICTYSLAYAAHFQQDMLMLMGGFVKQVLAPLALA